MNTESPYGTCPEGERFDALLMDLVSKGDLKGIISIDHSLREKAAECGFRSIVMLCGALDGLAVKTDKLSYEAPFGIGYGVATLLTAEPVLAKNTTANPQHVRIAKAALQAYIGGRRRITPEEADAPPELLQSQAGVFVSLHKFGDLRGCIGTIAPTTGSIAEEIIQNAISASTGDPRFNPVTADELPFLEVNVDVLNPAEPVRSKADLDPKLYGVIVEKGRSRGLLLPDLEGVDTVAQQLDIACRKGGIDPSGEYRISRFTITRYAE